MSVVKLRASSLRTVMIILFVISAGSLVGGFYYAQNWLGDIALTNKSNSSTVDNSSSQTLTEAQKLANEKSLKIISSNQDYQTKIIDDINLYASKNNISIENSGQTQSPAGANSTPLINGVQLNYLTVTLKNPVNYENLMKFIKAIETNIPKIQITSLTINQNGKVKDSVNVEPLILEVYTR
ncbi:MAG: hypothetical protein WCK26_01290 [Candidatus Saccharibacteria bacterium]